MQIAEITYNEDSSLIFNYISTMSHPVFLDSNSPAKQHGRFDIISANPKIIIKTFGNYSKIIEKNIVKLSYENPFKIISKYLSQIKQKPSDLPFIGGAIGFFGYDLAHRIFKLPKLIPQDLIFPDMFIGIYYWCVVVDHFKQKSYFIQQDNDDKIFDQIKKKLKKNIFNHDTYRTIKFSPSISKKNYIKGYNTIKSHIDNGNCYQVNLSHRFQSAYYNHPWTIYKKLRSKNDAAFSAYIDTGHGQILCNSPENFLKVNQSCLETTPIKGTIKKSLNSDIDHINSMRLLADPKNRAENLMIVDLLRNDLYKSCDTNSIEVIEFCKLMELNSVFHLKSKIKATLLSHTHPLEAFMHAFPGGSVTGAPKKRAMQISETVEFVRRTIFCGSIGYISFDKKMDSNIIIRSLLAYKRNLYCWAGGGIVADSNLEEEYNETLSKLENIFRTLS